MRKQDVASTINKIIEGSRTNDLRAHFFRLWRLLPIQLARTIHPDYLRLPADTRSPDHSIWHHLDTTAALAAASPEKADIGYLIFDIGPVQTFIETARSLRDLWSGSLLLSWLTFHGMIPIIEQLGPTAVLYPNLRGNPFLDLWLLENGFLSEDVFQEQSVGARLTPCLPNRFLAIVPWGDDGKEAFALKTAALAAVRQEWASICDCVRDAVSPAFTATEKEVGCLPEGWDRRWQEQVANLFDIHVSTFRRHESLGPAGLQPSARPAPHGDQWYEDCFGHPFSDSFADAAAIRSMANHLGSQIYRDARDTTGRWQASVFATMRLLAAEQTLRHIPSPGETPMPSETPTTSETHGQSGTTEKSPPKCSLFGSYEQMGPDDFDQSRQFWERAREIVRLGFAGIDASPHDWPGPRIRLYQGERFCAPALVKRFCVPAFLAPALKLTKQEGEWIFFPDTATIAAAVWLRDAGIDPAEIRARPDCRHWNGQWVFWDRKEQDKDEEPVPDSAWEDISKAQKNESIGRPSAYFAILKMDADGIGGLLRGEVGPKAKNVYHPKIRAHLEGMNDPVIDAGLNATRPVSPARHAAISEALANFATRVVPHVVQKLYAGRVIYAGGDDLLAVLPARFALDCARTLRLAFAGDPKVNNGADSGYYRCPDSPHDWLVMGRGATLSAGIAVVHYKEDLRLALQSARDAEKAAKQAGRDALELRIRRRSGEHTAVLLDWSIVPTVNAWITAFSGSRGASTPAAGGDKKTKIRRASDRWTYHLRQEALTLAGGALPPAAVEAEIRRLVDRSDDDTRAILGSDPEAGSFSGQSTSQAGTRIAEAYAAYRTARIHRLERVPKERHPSDLSFLTDFVTLCQSASFLARARDKT